MSDNLWTHTEQWTQLLSSLQGTLDASWKCTQPEVFSRALWEYLQANSWSNVPDILQQLSEELRVSNSPEIQTALSDAHESVVGILQEDTESPLSLSERINRATTLQECFSEEVVRVAEDLKRNAGMLVKVYTLAGYKTCTQGKVLGRDGVHSINRTRNRTSSRDVVARLLQNNVDVRIMTDKDAPIIPWLEVISLEFIWQAGQYLRDDYGRPLVDPRWITFIIPENYDKHIRDRMLSDPQFTLEILLYLEPTFLYTHTNPKDGFFPSWDLSVLTADFSHPLGWDQLVKTTIGVPNKEEAEKLNNLGWNQTYLYRNEV